MRSAAQVWILESAEEDLIVKIKDLESRLPQVTNPVRKESMIQTLEILKRELKFRREVSLEKSLYGRGP